MEYLSFKDMETIVSGFLDIPVTEIQIKRSFGRAAKKVIKGGDGTYKISNPGETYLRGLRKDEPLTVLYIEAGKPRTAKKTLEDQIKSIPKGQILICDPYYGIKTFDILEAFAKVHTHIKFLTREHHEKQASITRAVADFKKEYSNVEIRVISDKSLHDRYILAKDRFFIVGHGIKDLGNRESLIVLVEDRYGKDIRKTIESQFNGRWKKATNL